MKPFPNANPDSLHTIFSCGIQFANTLSFDEWQRIGERLMLNEHAIGFQIGDWINYGQSRYGEKYTAAIACTGIPDKTLKNYAYVARKISPALREPGLGFEIHAALAKLKPHEQKRWLKLAIDHNLSVRRLRASMRKGSLATEVEVQENTADRGKPNSLAMINQLRRRLRQQFAKCPVENWEKDRRLQLKRDLRPLIEIYESL